MASAATLNADTKEGQLLEIVERLAVDQQDTAKNPNNATIITAYNRNNLTGILTVSITMQTVDTIDATTGGIKVEADPVFID
jgi:hypothetical protein